MARTKEQNLAITIEDYRGCPDGLNPEPERRTKHFSDHQSYLRAMSELGDVDAHVREETRSTVRLYAEAKQSDMFKGDGEKSDMRFDDDLATLEEDLAQAMEANTREARLEQVSAAMEAFSEAHPEPSDDQREAILEVYEPVRAELASADKEAQPRQSQAADDILEGNTALDEEDEGDGDADEEDG